MTTNRTSHTDCSHEATKAARAKCRATRDHAATKRFVEVSKLIEVLDQDAMGRDWVAYGARHFAGLQDWTDRTQPAAAILDYFAPSGDDAKDARRKANGYIITTDPYTIRRIILRVAS